MELFINRISKAKQFILSILVVCTVSAICYTMSGYIGYKVVAFILLFTVSLLAVTLDILPVLSAAVLSALIVMEKFLSNDNELPLFEKLIMQFQFWIKDKSLSEEKGFGLDQSNVTVEKFPLMVGPQSKISLKHVQR